jgi:hypothetical protein
MLCPRSLLCFLAAFICLLDTHAVEGSPAVEGNGSANRRADDGSQLIDFSLSDDTHIDEEDAYICIPVEFPKEEGFIIKYEQFFDAAYVHHALMFGCPEPVNKQQWYGQVNHFAHSWLIK